jgi:hypothetical protein
MASIRAVWRVGMNNFKTWSANPRIYLIALFLALYLGSALQTLRDYLVATGLPVTPWAIVPLLNDGGAQLFLLAGAVVLFCDAPFLDRQSPYVMVRTGKARWTLGQVLYVLLASLAYYAFAILAALLNLVPYLTRPNIGWGRALLTLAQTSDSQQVALWVDYQVMLDHTPLEAALLTVGIGVLTTAVLGLLMFVCNLLSNRFTGVVVGAVYAFLSQFAYEIPNDMAWLRYFIPSSWVNLSFITSNPLSFFPKINEVLLILPALVLLLAGVGYLAMRRRTVEVLPQI